MANKNNFATRIGIIIFGTAVCAALYFMTQTDRTGNDSSKETTEVAPAAANPAAENTAELNAPEGENAKKYADHLSNYSYEEGVPTIIDFFATWCGPCKRMAPDLHKVAEEYKGKLNVITVDVDQDTEFAKAAGIQAMPTLFLIDKQGMIQNHVGALDYTTLKQIAEELTK